MSKTITINAANSTSITVNAADSDTLRTILRNAQVLSFFSAVGADDVIDAFSSYETEDRFVDIDDLPTEFVIAVLDTTPEDGATVYVELNGRSAQTAEPAASASPAAQVTVNNDGTVSIPVSGTIQVKWNGGMNSCPLSGINFGVTTIGNVLANAFVASRFNTTTAALSACDITVQNGTSSCRVTQQAAQTRPVQDGDIIWLQARAADDKGC